MSNCFLSLSLAGSPVFVIGFSEVIDSRKLTWDWAIEILEYAAVEARESLSEQSGSAFFKFL